MSQSVIRAFPVYINGQKVAEATSTTEDRTVNAANQYGIDGVIGQSIGADEIKIDLDAVVPVLGMGIDIDSLIGVPCAIGLFRNGKMALSQGVITSSNYSGESKGGEGKAKYSYIGGAPMFIG